MPGANVRWRELDGARDRLAQESARSLSGGITPSYDPYMLTPGTLVESTTRITRSALDCGALLPIETTLARRPDQGVDFMIRRVVRTRKPRGEPSDSGSDENPFLPYDTSLYVGDLSPTHVALLNKYQVLAHHLLATTPRRVIWKSSARWPLCPTFRFNAKIEHAS